MNKKVVITYGTFDLFHIGHLNIIKRMKEYGDFLVIAVSTDEFNLKKNKKTVIPYEQRAEIVRNIKGVDLVIPETTWEQKVEDVKKYNVDTFIIGKDWEGKFDFLKEYCEVIYLDRTNGISTTQKKAYLKSLLQADSPQEENAIQVLSTIINDLE